jgi:hypothetical protein
LREICQRFGFPYSEFKVTPGEFAEGAEAAEMSYPVSAA